MDLRERTLAEIRLVKDILKLSLGDVHPSGVSVTADQVRDFYRELEQLWPLGTSIHQLVAGGRQLRGFYWGSAHPRTLGRTLTRYSLYYDQILVLDPCANYTLHAPEESPVQRPDKYQHAVAHEALALLQLERWVRKGIVLSVPHPAPFDPGLIDHSERMAKIRLERLQNTRPDLWADYEYWSLDGIWLEFLLGVPPQQLERLLKEYFPSASPDQIERRHAEIRDEQSELGIPSVDLGTMPGGRVKWGEYVPLEAALALCDSWGACAFCDQQEMWLQLRHVAEDNDVGLCEHTRLAAALAELEFKFPNKAPVDLIISLREDGSLSRLRSFLQDSWTDISQSAFTSTTEQAVSSFADRLHGEYAAYCEEWAEIDRKFTRSASIGGAEVAISILCGQISWPLALGVFGHGASKLLLDASSVYSERAKLLRRPLGAFMRLYGPEPSEHQ